jgi:hypothetical protein
MLSIAGAVLVLLAPTGCARAPRPSLAPPGAEAPEVEVSARRVRVTFPVDTSGRWSLPARDRVALHGVAYEWGMRLEAMDRPANLLLWVRQADSAAQLFTSLAALVAAGRAELCTPGMFEVCDVRVKVASGVAGDRIVLTLTDRASITRLFGLRPATVTVWRVTPYSAPEHPSGAVPVRYVAPQIPLPDSATWAAAVRGRRAYQARISTITRRIGTWGDLWLSVGDTIPLPIDEEQCVWDVCGGVGNAVADSGWSVDDSAVVTLTRTCGDDHRQLRFPAPAPGNACVVAHAHRIGRTVVRVRGLHGVSDTLPSEEPPASTLERAVIVGPVVSRLEWTTRPDTSVVGDSVTFQVRALDRAGNPIAGSPVALSFESGPHSQVSTGATGRMRFDTPGRRRVVATLRGLADTVVVTVVERR